MRKSVILPVLAVLGGGVGLLLRRWELATSFEHTTRLPIPGAPATLALVLLSVALAAALLLLCLGKHSRFPRGYDQAFAAKGNTVYIATMVLAAFLALAAGVLSLLRLQEAYAVAAATAGMNPVLAVLPKALLALLAVGCFFSLLALGKNGYRGEGRGKYSGSLLVPAYMASMWLISAYQNRAGDPIRLDYIYELLAIIAALLGFYFMASFSFERGRVLLAVPASLLGVYFSMVTLADAHDLATILLYGFSILYLLAGATTLLYNDGLPTSDLPAAPMTETTTEETTDA